MNLKNFNTKDIWNKHWEEGNLNKLKLLNDNVWSFKIIEQYSDQKLKWTLLNIIFIGETWK